ncbi:MAG: hypothetical protein GY913_09235 [Proteobacteria bacterium]|nr:hypothetical protein [Pseudomonadota bacterium]MCP4917095.1 hypothetical protein [Pseudomonadota bacterium]
MRTLVADIGGTNCRLALFEGRTLHSRSIVPTEGDGLLGPLRRFLGTEPPAAACIAVAGPVRDGHAALTNHRWQFHEADLSEALGCPTRLVNDFHAAARGVPELPASGHRGLCGREPGHGVAAVLGPGTGLGQALLAPTDDDWMVFPGEGGHVEFGPNDDEEVALWSFLAERYTHVSYERILSGQGFIDLHAFYRHRGLEGPVPAKPSDVTTGPDPASTAAVARFVRILGAQAGNLALSLLPPGGVWICGGIAPRLDLTGLVEGYTHKGRFGEVVADIPLRLVTDPRLGLLGAAALAREVVR